MTRKGTGENTAPQRRAAPGANATAGPAGCGTDVSSVAIDGAVLHYFECGEGEPVVFVHGSLGDLHSFDAQAEAFAERFRVVVYSRRYHPPNEGTRPGDAYDLRLHVGDLATLVRVLELGPVHLVGESYGAYVALALAVERPELVRSLVLAEPPVLPLLAGTPVGAAVLESFQRQALAPSRDAFREGRPEEGLQRFLDGVLGVGLFEGLPEEARTDLVETKADGFRLEMLTDPARYMPPLSPAAIGRLELPVLLLDGERSPALFLLVTAELDRLLGRASFAMVPEAGHAMHEENAAFYNRTVLDFLTSDAAPSAR